MSVGWDRHLKAAGSATPRASKSPSYTCVRGEWNSLCSMYVHRVAHSTGKDWTHEGYLLRQEVINSPIATTKLDSLFPATQPYSCCTHRIKLSSSSIIHCPCPNQLNFGMVQLLSVRFFGRDIASRIRHCRVYN